MRLVRRIAIVVLSAILIVLGVGYGLLRGSLPRLDGEIAIATLSAPVSIERDSQGVVTITARNRVDLAYATGYAHGQDRFFQMDLQRRLAAGELAELLGKDLVDTDKRFRRHDFRHVARQVVAQATSEQKKILDAYVAGVNAGRDTLSVRPFEYLMLQTQPQPWAAEDCVLVAFAMYIDLNDSDGAHELERARLHAALPQAVFDLLYPRGTEWDAPMDGVDVSNLHAPIPGADVIDLRAQPSTRSSEKTADADYPGSNNWAIAKDRTTNGALVANDMHLSFRLPHIWYRARLVVKSDDASLARDLTGVTLPGLPLLVAGSNKHVAWGFTNTHGDYDDLVIIESDAQHPNQYRNQDKYLEYNLRRERINVRGGAPIEVEYRDTIWGPLVDATLDDKPLALAWTAQHPEATNLNQSELERATTVSEALDIANTVGIPVQNLIVADAQ
ncbi:MAG TPA: penicillin acylase family protein, partial [Steroidobacteraceae bacterium]|nr:penicillin acylase family protein [Steroidobacteraceae bacterium]